MICSSRLPNFDVGSNTTAYRTRGRLFDDMSLGSPALLRPWGSMNEMSQSKIGVRLLPQPGSLSLSGLIPHPGLQPSVGVLDPGSPKSTRPSIALIAK